jgi:hypothetical protein
MTAREIQIDVKKDTHDIAAVLKPFREMEAWMRDLDIFRLHLAGHTDEQIAKELEDDTSSASPGERHSARVRVTQNRVNVLCQQEIYRILQESRPDYVAIREDRLGPHLLHPWGPPPPR